MRAYNKSLLLVVFSAFCIWGIAQTNQSAGQKAEGENAANNGVTITQGPGASIPEGPEPQGGWFTPLYTVEGVLNKYGAGRSNSLSLESALGFVFSADSNNRWQAEYRFYNKGMDIWSTNHFFSDGTNYYTVLVSDKFMDLDGIIKKDTIMSSAGCIYPGPVPANLDNGAGLLWMAFIGGGYLLQNEATQQQGTYRMVDVLSNASSYLYPWCCDLRYVFLTNSHNPLISKGEFVLNTNYISLKDSDYLGIEEEMVKSEFITTQIEELKNISTNNLCYSEFILKETKSVNDRLRVPVRFSSKNYHGVSSDDPNKMPFYTIEGIVTNIITGKPVVPVLPKLGLVSVQDFRFRYRTEDMFRDSILYLCTNEWELTMDSPKLREAGSQKLIKRTFIKENKERNYIFISILILAVFTPLIILPIIFHFRKQG